MQITQENELSPNETVFFDQAIPDAIAYYRFLGLPEDEKIREAMGKASYKKVFILDPLPLVKDSVRTEDEAAQKKIHRLLTETYELLPTPVIHVPVLPPEERIDFILKNI